MKIKSKFILVGIAGTLALIVIVLLALSMGNLSVKTVDKVFENSKKVQNIYNNLISPVYELRRLSLSLVVAPNDDIRKNINKNIDTLVNRLDNTFSKEFKIGYESWNKYKNSLLKTRGYIEKNFEEGAYINANEDEKERFDKLIIFLQNLQKNELQISSTFFQKAKQNIDEFRWIIIVSSFMIALTILSTAWRVIQKITDAIIQVTLGHERFFKFIKDKKERDGIYLDTNDELGMMAKTINLQMNETKLSLKEDLKLIEESTKMLEEVKKGNIDKRIEVDTRSAELHTLKNVINELANDLERKIQDEITKRTSQEKLLIQQSKLATMGNMIGNIAHQWRQPLSELNATLMNIETRYKFGDFDGDFMEKSVKECNEITNYMSNTISDFQNFFKPSKQKMDFDVIKACKRATSIIKSSLKNNHIAYRFSADEERIVYGYPNEFSQAFLNILTNAKDVLISRKIENPHIHVEIKTGKKYVLIKVKDNARGIKKEYLERIFEPYFTTKHAKQGTGIGLYMSKMIIEENMDGFLNVENLKDGACFTIKLQ